MSIKDVIKSSFLEGLGYAAPSLRSILICLAASALLGVYIYVIYRLLKEDDLYSAGYNLSLTLISVITAAIILTIQSSIIVSLGMVGALSIVRFRTALKDPMDLVFMFWSISTGIISGTGMIGLAAALSVLITLLCVILYKIPGKKVSQMVSVHADDPQIISEIKKTIEKYDKRYIVQTREISEEGLNLLVSVKCRDEEGMLQELYEIKGVTNVSAIGCKANTMF